MELSKRLCIKRAATVDNKIRALAPGSKKPEILISENAKTTNPITPVVARINSRLESEPEHAWEEKD